MSQLTAGRKFREAEHLYRVVASRASEQLGERQPLRSRNNRLDRVQERLAHVLEPGIGLAVLVEVVSCLRMLPVRRERLQFRALRRRPVVDLHPKGRLNVGVVGDGAELGEDGADEPFVRGVVDEKQAVADGAAALATNCRWRCNMEGATPVMA